MIAALAVTVVSTVADTAELFTVAMVPGVASKGVAPETSAPENAAIVPTEKVAPVRVNA